MSTFRPWAEDAGLFLVLIILTDFTLLGLIWPELISVNIITATFYLALLVHVPLTFYAGTFGTLRTATWLLLIGAWAGSEILSFRIIAGFWGLDLRAASAVWPSLALLALGLDVVALLYTVWRRRALLHLAVYLVAVLVATVAVDLALSAIFSPSPLRATGGGEDDAFSIVPVWHALPFYALLRAVPNKAMGFFMMGAALLVPMIWPWARADRLRTGRMRWVWRLLCVTPVATLIGLGYLGLRPPAGPALAAAQILAIVYFSYFLVVPFALRRIGGGA
jgi:ubiquinol-cytochrome c reductase cytochrome b subunit